MWFIFFAALLMTVVCSVIYVRHFHKVIRKELRFFTYGISAVIILLAVSEIFFDFAEFKGTFAIMGEVTAVEAVIYAYLQKNRSRTLAFMGKLGVIAIILELTLFQFPAYRLITGEYENTVLSIQDAEIEGSVYDPTVGGVPVKGIDEVSIGYHDLDLKIGTVYVTVGFDDYTRQVKLDGDMTEETGYFYRLAVDDTRIISESPYSQYSMVQLAGNSDSARFRFYCFYPEDTCVIEGIELNKPIPFDVMPLRLVIAVFLGTFLYACVFSYTMRRKYSENRYFCRVAGTWMTILAICCGILLVLQQIPQGQFLDRFRQTEGDQITEELVTAFEHGHFYLDAEPTEELLAMENPYDDGKRFYDKIDYLWDHAFYEGKYYSYYGVAPLLLFVPYHLITGYFFPCDIAVMIFGSVGLLLLSMIYAEVVRRWFNKISSGAYLSGLAIILASSGIWYSQGRPMFYELSISAGFMTFAAAAYFMITAGIFGKKAAKLPRVFLSSLLLGLAVMCRPTLAVYAVCGCIFYLMALGRQKKNGKPKIVPYLACAFLPLMALGLFQMYYNYSRFGSILEFGIKYSLTINDFTRTEFHMHNMFIGLYNFLLAPPAFIPDYPFVSAPFSYLGLNSYYFKDEGTISGILFLALPVFGYIFSGKALKRIPDRKLRRRAAVIVGLTCFVMPVVIVCSVWESGYSARYMADFSWQTVIGAYAILFYLFTHTENTNKKNIFTAAMGICCVYTLIVVGVEAYVFSFPVDTCPRYADVLDRMLSFYK